jgi:hypothetical protein
MILDEAKSIALLIIASLAIVILLRILIVVHRQSGRVKELEARMKAFESMNTDDMSASSTVSTDETKGE